MPITIPTKIAPMPQGVAPIKSYLVDTPPEGNKRVSGEVNWGQASLQPAGFTAMQWDCAAGQGSNSWSNVKAIYVDNLNSDADVFFIDNSTRFQLQIPARTEGLFPVEMAGSAFIISCPLAAATDSVNFQAYNFLPPPVATIPPFLTSQTVVTGIAIASGTTNLVTSSGILTGLVVVAANVTGGAAGGTDVVIIQDGTGAQLAGAMFGFATTQFIPNITLLSLTGINLRFRNGLNLVQTAGGTAPTSGNLVVTTDFR